MLGSFYITVRPFEELNEFVGFDITLRDILSYYTIGGKSTYTLACRRNYPKLIEIPNKIRLNTSNVIEVCGAYLPNRKHLFRHTLNMTGKVLLGYPCLITIVVTISLFLCKYTDAFERRFVRRQSVFE